MHSVVFVRAASDIDAALWDACFPPPLEGRWWYEALERSHLDDQFTFLYGVISRDGTPIGIAPAFVMNFPVSLVAPDALKPLLPLLGRLAHPKTLFIGSPCADEGTVGLVPGTDGQAALSALQSTPFTRAFCRMRWRQRHHHSRKTGLGGDTSSWRERPSGSRIHWLRTPH